MKLAAARKIFVTMKKLFVTQEYEFASGKKILQLKVNYLQVDGWKENIFFKQVKNLQLILIYLQVDRS
jgi:hypothetical protein